LLPTGTVPWYLDFLAKIVGTILRTKGNDLPYWTRFLVRFWGRKKLYLFIYTSVADPDSESNAFLTPGSGSGMNNPDHISQSLETIFWVKIILILWCGSMMEKNWIRDKHPGIGYATLICT
jgi:hypothetical protein